MNPINRVRTLTLLATGLGALLLVEPSAAQTAGLQMHAVLPITLHMSGRRF